MQGIVLWCNGAGYGDVVGWCRVWFCGVMVQGMVLWWDGAGYSAVV